MALPKSQIKISKDGNITFVNNINLYSHSVKELARAANRDIAKLIIKETRKKMRMKTGKAKKTLQYWNKRDGVLHIGYKKRVPGFYAGFFEVGYKTHQGTLYQEAPLLLTVEENFDKLQAIAGYYFKNFINEAEKVINEDEEISDE